MTQAFNLAQLANNVNSAGELAGSAVNGAVSEAESLTTTNFTIVESGGKLLIKYGATTIVSISSTGEIIASNNVTAYGTP